MCPHGGQVQVVPSQTRMTLGGQPALLVSDLMVIVGCPFTVGTKYQPCVTVEWTGPTVRAKINGQPLLLQTSIGLCKSAESVPQGTVLISGVQTKVKAE